MEGRTILLDLPYKYPTHLQKKAATSLRTALILTLPGLLSFLPFMGLLSYLPFMALLHLIPILQELSLQKLSLQNYLLRTISSELSPQNFLFRTSSSELSPQKSFSQKLFSRGNYFLNVSFKPVVLLKTAFSGVESLSATK